MPRPVHWSRDVHNVRERASRSKTETWSRQDIQYLFGIGSSSAQSLMKLSIYKGCHSQEKNQRG